MTAFSDEQYGLDQEDKDLVASIGAAPDPNALQPIAADVPEGLLPETDLSPVMEGPQLDPNAELPSALLDDVAATPSPAPDEAPKGPATSEDIIRKQGGLEKEQAQVNADVAAQQADFAKQHNEDLRLAYADYLARRQIAEQNLDRRIKELDAAKLEDPRTKDPHKSRVSIIFGALGAGLAGGSNQNLEMLQKKWHDDTERQKVNIGLLQDKVALARTGLRDAADAKRELVDIANAQLISNYNTAIKQGEKTLKKLGIPAAEIAQDERLQKLQMGKAAAVALAQKQQDEHELKRSQIELNKARAAREGRRGKGGGGGGGNSAAEAILTKMAEDGASMSAITAKGAELGIKGKDARAIASAVDVAEGRAKKGEDKSGQSEVFNPATGETYGNAPTAARAAKATEDLKLIEGVRNDIKALKQHLNDPKTKGSVLPFGISEAGRERERLTKSLIVKLSAFNNLGAISADDRKILESIVNGGVSALLGLSNEQMDGLLAQTDKAKQTVLNVHGLNKGGKAEGKPETAPAKYSAKDIAAARQVQADPGSYDPKDRAKASKILQSLVQ